MALTNKIKTRIFYAAVLIVFLTFVGYCRYSLQQLEANHNITTGLVDEVKIVGRERQMVVKYHFIVEGKVYYDEASFSHSQMTDEKNFMLLEDRGFPVAYNLNNSGVSSNILIFPNQLEAFKVPFPDSMKWILPLMGK